MWEKIRVVFTIPELRQKILLTLLFLAIYRIGWWISLPIVDVDQMRQHFGQATGGLGDLLGQVAVFSASNLSQARSWLAGLSDGATYGYFAGGTTGDYVATADRITFSTGATAANTASNLSQARTGPTGLSDGMTSTYGYFAGGYTDAVVATADRVTFSTGATAANTASNLSQARYNLAGLSDGATYGYFAGGYTSAVVTTADRITFSTGVAAANTASDLSQARAYPAGLSDKNV